VVCVGLYFLLLRPPLLAEDLRYLGQTAAEMEASVPRLASWLRHVFAVMGGYAVATGLLTIALAATSFRARRRGAMATAAAAGGASIGWMTAVNFAIDSDFKWVLFVIAVSWAGSLVLFGLEGRGDSATAPPGPFGQRSWAFRILYR
jgi:hypothetical protein